MFHFLLVLMLTATEPSTEIRAGIVEMKEIKFASASEHESLTQNLFMDVAFPSVGKEELPAIIVIHGGGWEAGRRQDTGRIMNILAMGGYFVAAIDYRLTSEGGGFPNAVHDCNAAIRFLKHNADVLGVDPKNIGLVGVSAGGHLAVLSALGSGEPLIDGKINGEDESTAVACVGTISGAVMPEKSEKRRNSPYAKWASQHGHEIELTLPSTYIDEGDPPVFLLCGSRDTVCPSRYSKVFSNKLTNANVVSEIEIISGQDHSITKPEAYVGLLHFLDSHLGGKSELVFVEYLDKR